MLRSHEVDGVLHFRELLEGGKRMVYELILAVGPEMRREKVSKRLNERDEKNGEKELTSLCRFLGCDDRDSVEIALDGDITRRPSERAMREKDQL